MHDFKPAPRCGEIKGEGGWPSRDAATLTALYAVNRGRHQQAGSFYAGRL